METFSEGDRLEAAAGDRGGLNSTEGSKLVAAAAGDSGNAHDVEREDAVIMASSDRLLLLLTILLLLRSRFACDIWGERTPPISTGERRADDSSECGGGGSGDSASRDRGDGGCRWDAGGDGGGEGK